MEEKLIRIRDKEIFYQELTGEKSLVLFLHGKRFTSADWLGQKIIEKLSKKGHYLIALDLPGFGQSQEIPELIHQEFLQEFCQKLSLPKFWLVGPSMSGKIALEFGLANQELLLGLIVMAPVEVPKYLKEMSKLNLPTLVMWGEEDQVVPVEEGYLLAQVLPQREFHLIRGGSHLCYFGEQELFAQVVGDYIQKQEKIQE